VNWHNFPTPCLLCPNGWMQQPRPVRLRTIELKVTTTHARTRVTANIGNIRPLGGAYVLSLG